MSAVDVDQVVVEEIDLLGDVLGPHDAPREGVGTGSEVTEAVDVAFIAERLGSGLAALTVVVVVSSIRVTLSVRGASVSVPDIGRGVGAGGGACANAHGVATKRAIPPIRRIRRRIATSLQNTGKIVSLLNYFGTRPVVNRMATGARAGGPISLRP